MIIRQRFWQDYIKKLRRMSDKAAELMTKRLQGLDLDALTTEQRMELIDYAYALATKYGEGAAALACEMYDDLAEISNAYVPLAIPANTAQYSEVAKAVNGTLKYKNIEMISSAVGRQVKMTGVDTVMDNAIRDGAEWAWIPSGDTCAFCITLASRGWQRASKKALRNGHAEHIHANCDCTYAVRFNEDTDVQGYDPGVYEDMYYGADGNTPEQRINAMRRKFYQDNKEKIREQQNSAYEKRKELNEPSAEEINVG